ncbi:hypothetical protein THIOM_000060 [Candidatus Thiomargarita nelsonii]|uniref:Uncharacterized protein n=1 Tax=Candidatus Thiomargarita nelsonii TaxID=1003181 RepID=A0A176S7P2_9GAMM|nr:hypothetical protein THIOM_000060 [Candidatus Thiomargarita nelsonii]
MIKFYINIIHFFFTLNTCKLLALISPNFKLFFERFFYLFNLTLELFYVSKAGF